jgi:predicted metal-dependent phosphoesterase TrpH
VNITLSEVYQRGGKLPGHPHFAAILTDKGYVRNPQQAFDYYLGQAGTCFVSRDEPTLSESVKRISAAGGLSSLAHPFRITRRTDRLERMLLEMETEGLQGLEVYYSEHSAKDTAFLRTLASRLGLAVTGGSDFHGAAKPDIRLGTGFDGTLHVPSRVLDDLRRINNFKRNGSVAAT